MSGLLSTYHFERILNPSTADRILLYDYIIFFFCKRSLHLIKDLALFMRLLCIIFTFWFRLVCFILQNHILHLSQFFKFCLKFDWSLVLNILNQVFLRFILFLRNHICEIKKHWAFLQYKILVDKFFFILIIFFKLKMFRSLVSFYQRKSH